MPPKSIINKNPKDTKKNPGLTIKIPQEYITEVPPSLAQEPDTRQIPPVNKRSPLINMDYMKGIEVDKIVKANLKPPLFEQNPRYQSDKVREIQQQQLLEKAGGISKKNRTRRNKTKTRRNKRKTRRNKRKTRRNKRITRRNKTKTRTRNRRR